VIGGPTPKNNLKQQPAALREEPRSTGLPASTTPASATTSTSEVALDYAVSTGAAVRVVLAAPPT